MLRIYHNETNQPVRTGDVVRGNLYEYTVTEVTDNGYVRLYNEAASPTLGPSSYGIRNFPTLTLAEVPDWFVFDLLKRGQITEPTTVNRVRVADSAFECGWLYNESGSGIHPADALTLFVLVLPNTGGLREPEFLPYVEDGVLYLQHESIPLASVGWYDQNPFDTRTHVVGSGSRLLRLSESTELDGTYYPTNEVRTINDGRVLPEWRIVEIDGELYDRNECFRLIDRRGNECDWSVDEPEEHIFIKDHDGWTHEENVVYCHGSGEPILNWDASAWGGEFYSESWLNDNTFVCDSCDERYHNDDYSSDGRCCNCDTEEDSRIRDYSCRDAADYRSERDVPIKFGIELEVEPKHGETSASLDVFDALLPDRYAIYKSDGSLSDEGFEIVTRPDCPSVHKRVWDKVLADPRVGRTTESWKGGLCGIHIHVSRRPLSDLWVGRMIVFINSPTTATLIEKIAGRYNRGYCEIDHRKKLTDGKCGCGDSRYAALNTSGRRTIEFRIFRGTVNRERFLKNIEFVEAVLAYCRPAARSLRTIDDPDKFVAFVSSNRKSYPHLHKLLIGALEQTGD